jgi:NAD(P)H-hydrate epimerase
MILLSASESRELDRLSQEKYGVASYSLMTNAGEAVARVALERHGEALRSGVLVVAGRGNNGGDGMVAARSLKGEGIEVRAVLLGTASQLKGDAARALSDYLATGAKVVEADSEQALVREFSRRPGAVVDAIFGTGLNADVAGLPRHAIEMTNSLGVPTVAVDIASGVNSDTGAVMGAAVRASTTVTFGFAKYGHVSYPGAEYCGELRIAEIGFAPGAIGDIAPRGRFLEAADVRGLVGRRPMNSHKGQNGHVMVIAGGRGKGGASLLTSRGALRTGAGLVTAAIPECVANIVASGQAELMTEPIPDRHGHFDADAAPDVLARLVEGKDALVVGPGIGVSDDTKRLVEWLILHGVAPERPVLIDADALNALAQLGCARAREARGAVVMTPHPGEMARLLGISTGAVNADRISAARTLSERTHAVVLLKGARSVIAGPEGEVYVNSTGNPGMGSPGMGDALSGMVGALMGQGLKALDALALGVFLHGYAADRVAHRLGRVGYLAGDVIEEIPRALEALAS